MRYIAMGKLPAKKHIQFRKEDGTLYAEQVFGTKGFSGIFSTLYHAYAPTEITAFAAPHAIEIPLAPDEALRHHHLKTKSMPQNGDWVSGRVPLLMNADVIMSLCRPRDAMTDFYKNADGDELIFVHEGSGRLETMFGTLPFTSGDYLVVPRGVIYRPIIESPDSRFLMMEAASAIEIPRRYRNEYGQILEHAPFSERDLHPPTELVSHDEPGAFTVLIKARSAITPYRYGHHPLDVAGWDGCLYPWKFSIHDFQPISGQIHPPPPAHQNFEAHNFVVCSFCPRMLDYHPQAIPVPYNHSNLDSDEVLYYCNDKFGSRKGIEVGSVTLHPSGIPHGPQPGAVEASLGKTFTEELAVMLDTFRPLKLTQAALSLDDPQYPYSWRR
jgi:homogentisate 1,2-dioxygenase